MRRRTFAALLTASLAGCVSSEPADSNASAGTLTGSDAGRATHSSPATTGPGDTSTPDPGETPPPPGGSAFAEADARCPPVLDACYHQATTESRAYVRPSTEHAPPQETIEFTLVNRSDASLFFGPYHWRVWRRETGGWVDLGPEAMLDLGYSLGPAESYSWTAVVDADGGEVWPGDRASERNTVAFTPGRYCFGIDVDAESGAGNDGGDESLGTLGCLFEVSEG